ncbi:ABC transporter permease [Paenibacillus doosanensis]|uniref:FtsX-like permease family protein n=1 Tax=Paenibacillus doosanensis TaxID=1229154 RepID=UPI00217FE24F|nr:ABC transporter permease [Paenibacillus doosanensis]MCS7464171.1 ABC transporter permease [Paenibacillus doosanensis]
MNFRQFAFKNVIRNKRLYAGYFFSCAFSVMIFFVYSMLAFHPDLNFSDKGSYGQGAKTSMDVSQYIIYVFTFFFILYSMSAFLKSRKKEFGIGMMLGMSGLQLRRLVFLENVMIGLASTAAGIAAGLLLSKGILMLGTSLLTLEQPLAFYWPIRAALLTFAAFTLLFLFISLFTAMILRSSSLIDLLKGTAKPKPEPKASAPLAVLAAVLLAVGYAAAFIVKGVLVLFALLPVAVIVSIGTYFLFTQLSVYVIRKLKGNQELYRSRTNLVTLSDLAYRMKDNARMFFLVAMISTVSFCAIGTLVGMKSMFTGQLSEALPVMKYESYSGNGLEAEQTALIEQSLANAGIDYKPYVIHKKSSANTATNKTYKFVSVTEYNFLMNDNAVVGDKDALLFYPDDMGFGGRAREQTGKIASQDGSVFAVTQSGVMPIRLQQLGYADVAVISDAAFQAMPASQEDSASFVYDVTDWRSTLAVSKELNLLLEGGEKQYEFISRAYAVHENNQSFGQILLTGLFIGAVFFVAAGSFLYFRLYADLPQDCVQYRAITKLGLTEGELSRIVSVQIGLLFFVPIVVAVVHGAVALNTLQNTFGVNLFKESALVLGAFTVIQIVYFLFIRAGYVKKLKEAVQ